MESKKILKRECNEWEVDSNEMLCLINKEKTQQQKANTIR